MDHIIERLKKRLEQRAGSFKSEKQALAAFTAVIYFKDGNARKFHSDLQQFTTTKSGTVVEDHIAGLESLERLITQKFEGKYKTALIYENLTGSEVRRFIDGKLIKGAIIHWKYTSKGEIFITPKNSKAS